MSAKTEMLGLHSSATSAALFPNLLRIALHALQVVRPFIKMNAEQSAAWSIVTELLGGNST